MIYSRESGSEKEFQILLDLSTSRRVGKSTKVGNSVSEPKPSISYPACAGPESIVSKGNEISIGTDRVIETQNILHFELVFKN